MSENEEIANPCGVCGKDAKDNWLGCRAHFVAERDQLKKDLAQAITNTHDCPSCDGHERCETCGCGGVLTCEKVDEIAGGAAQMEEQRDAARRNLEDQNKRMAKEASDWEDCAIVTAHERDAFDAEVKVLQARADKLQTDVLEMQLLAVRKGKLAEAWKAVAEFVPKGHHPFCEGYGVDESHSGECDCLYGEAQALIETARTLEQEPARESSDPVIREPIDVCFVCETPGHECMCGEEAQKNTKPSPEDMRALWECGNGNGFLGAPIAKRLYLRFRDESGVE